MIPNLVVMAPMDGIELRHMTHTALLYEEGPIALRFPRGTVQDEVGLDQPPRRLEIGKGEVLREGDEICLIGIGTMTGHALAAAEALEEDEIHVGVINARFVKPLDRELLLEAARRYACLITIEDNVIAGGFGSAVGELLMLEGVEIRLIQLGFPDKFIEHAPQASLYHKYGLSAESIAARVREITHAGARIQDISRPSLDSAQNQ
jgi:1-deoxy-D-xylulose-5-phosphate synthase